MVTHSNDGDGDVAGNIKKVPPSSYALPSNRSVSGGAIPQVTQTYGYFTEGYGVMNEWQVGLGESTCYGVYSPAGGMLNIVDLGQLCLGE